MIDVEINDHPTDHSRVTVRLKGKEHLFLNLSRSYCRELGAMLSQVQDVAFVPADDEPSAA